MSSETTVKGQLFVLPAQPETWSEMSFGAKRQWIMGNSRPRASFGQAQSILAQHGAAKRRAAKARAVAQAARYSAPVRPHSEVDDDGQF